MDKEGVLIDFLKFTKSIGISDLSRFEPLFDFLSRLQLVEWDFYKMDPSEMEELNKKHNGEFSVIYGYAKYHKRSS